MQFKDVAYEILKEAGESLHYNEITDRAIEANILTTSGQPPHATMVAFGKPRKKRIFFQTSSRR